ncbi:MAG: site-2 protease family protein [Clostridia bacterium]|nr:site-2 protease family protein [Clostridia bacterium]
MSISQWLHQLDYSRILEIGIAVIASLLCIILHECAHGLVAYWLGDPTAKRMGRLTLNPIKHIDPIGLLMMVVAHVGWAKPVPVNMRNFKHPKWGMALTSLAGPMCNFLIAVVFSIPACVFLNLTRGVDTGLNFWLFRLCFYITILSVGLGVFNLIPIPPLDGSKILFSLLPESAYMKLMRYERYGMIFLLVIVFASRFIPGLTSPLSVAIDWVSGRIFDLTFPVAKWILKLMNF